MSKTEIPERPPAGRGRGVLKRRAKEIERLAHRLAKLSDVELAKLPHDPLLSEEIAKARATRGMSSRKRQIKYLAGVLRDHDEERERLQAALDGQADLQRQAAHAFHHLEALRDRLCAAETFSEALAEAQATYPELDAVKVSSLARSTHGQVNKKASREVFRRLRKAAEAQEAGE